MYFVNAVVLALSVVGLTSAAPLQKRACSNLELVFARGTGDPGIVGPALHSSLKRLVPGATYKNVDYPAAIPFLTSAAMGSTAMKNHIEARNRECPQMKFALSGYSQGVMVIHGLNLNAASKAQVVAIATYGDPYKVIQAVAPWPINDKTGVLDKCASGDPICGGGFNILAHLGYGMDTMPAARHIASKFGTAGTGTAATGGLGGLLGGLTGGAAAPAASPAASPAAGGLGGLLGGLTGGAAAPAASPAAGGLGGLLGGLGGAAAEPAAPAASPAAGGLGGLLGGLGGAAAAPAAPAASPAASPAAGGLGGLLGGLGGDAAAAEPAGGLLGGLFGRAE